MIKQNKHMSVMSNSMRIVVAASLLLFRGGSEL